MGGARGGRLGSRPGHHIDGDAQKDQQRADVVDGPVPEIRGRPLVSQSCALTFSLSLSLSLSLCVCGGGGNGYFLWCRHALMNSCMGIPTCSDVTVCHPGMMLTQTDHNQDSISNQPVASLS